MQKATMTHNLKNLFIKGIQSTEIQGHRMASRNIKWSQKADVKECSSITSARLGVGEVQAKML